MYILQCPGGFSIPAVAGRFEIKGFCVTVNNPNPANHSTGDTVSQFALVDDDQIQNGDKMGKILSTLTNKANILINLKGLYQIDTVLSYEWLEAIKLRHGLSVYYDNVVPGSVCVYVR